jgi:hypothetical protein
MGAALKEKMRDARRRARARRRNELLEDGLLAAAPKKRNPTARVRCMSPSNVAVGERLAVKLDKNLSAVLKRVLFIHHLAHARDPPSGL